MLVEIKVSKKDIKVGCSDNASHCPAARRLKKTLGRRSVLVGSGYSHFLDGDQVVKTAKNPKELKTFIYRFDNGKETKPETFRLDFKKWSHFFTENPKKHFKKFKDGLPCDSPKSGYFLLHYETIPGFYK